MQSSNKKIQVTDLKNTSYQPAWDLQEKLLKKIVELKITNRKVEIQQPTPNYFLWVEHPPVITLGKSGAIDHLLLNEEQLRDRGIEYFKTNRGGDITFHGLGQVVGYPILDLDYFFSDIHKYLRLLEEAVILTLADYGVAGQRLDGFTGVWVDAEKETPRKICAIGVKCSRWVTMHGIGFNINSNLDYFKHIVPCGIEDKSVTSLQKETNQEIDMEELKVRFKKNFKILFGINWIDKK